MSEERTYVGLRRFNLVMGFLHLPPNPPLRLSPNAWANARTACPNVLRDPVCAVFGRGIVSIYPTEVAKGNEGC
jgi:hypothetical protein